MATLTLDIDDAKLARAREAAALQRTTVEDWLASQVDRLAPRITPEQQEAIDWMIAQSKANAGRRRSGALPTREETYDREVSGPR